MDNPKLGHPVAETMHSILSSGDHYFAVLSILSSKYIVEIWQPGQYLQCRVIPLLCLLMVLWLLQWPISLSLNYYCVAVV